MSREVDRTARLARPRPREAAPELGAYLVVVVGADLGARFPVGAGRTLVGRAEPAPILLTDAGVSARHCEVWREGRVLWVEDAGSSNGTRVDGQLALAPTAVDVGSLLEVGRSALRYELRGVEEVERERERDGELARAAGYVEAILPAPIARGAVRVEWRFVPSSALGGDAFGYGWLDQDRFELYLLDVSGHGAQAALHTVAAVQALRRAGPAGSEPGAVLSALNRDFGMESHGGLYLTVWYGVFDRRDRRLRFASAGHPAPLVVAPGEAPERLALRSPPVGLAPGLDYREAERTLVPGSRLYLFSDGVFELRTGEGVEWGYEQLVAVVGRPPVPGLDESLRIEIDVRAAMAGRAYEDDFSLLVATFD